EDAREWWGRLGGILSLMTLCLSALFFISIDGPWLIGLLEGHNVLRWALATVWAAITGAGIAAGKVPAKSDGGLKLSPSLLAKVAPPVFVLGLLLILSLLTKVILSFFASKVLPAVLDLLQVWLGSWTITVDSLLGVWPSPVSAANPAWGRIEWTLGVCLWLLIVFSLGVALFLSWREGINRFSMHSLYRNRLVRCYLGASNDKRHPQPFTGMDPEDDSILFGDLLADGEGHYAGPFPIYNTTLNLLSTKNLAWQQRKGASFVFTPIYSGFEFTSPEKEGETISALRETSVFHKKLKLGLAMAISGAAASPNMGSHSSPALSFLMTVFNVRLGWWLSNPYRSKWGSMGPGVGLFYLI